jgi:hypothetical protein
VSDLPPPLLSTILSLLPPATARHAAPRVCKAWAAALAGPAPAWKHVAVDVGAEVAAPRGEAGEALRAVVVAAANHPRGPASSPPPRLALPTLRFSALHAWLTPRAPALRSLALTGLPHNALAAAAGPRHDLTSPTLAALLALAAPTLEELVLERAAGLLGGATWAAVGACGRLRVLAVRGVREALPGGEEMGALAALAPTLRELVIECDPMPPSSPAPTPAAPTTSAPADTAVAAAAGLGPACKWGLPSFPAGVAHLAHLTHVTLSSHLGITALPADFGARLGALEQLGLDGCGLGGLPPSLGLLTGLTSLDLEANAGLGWGRRVGDSAAASPPPASTPQPDPFPAALAGLTALKHANLNALGLASLPAVVGAWTALEALDAEANDFGRAPDPGAALAPLTALAPTLRTLNLAQCGLAALPDPVTRMAALRSLDLTANAIADGGLPAGPEGALAARLPSLRALGLAGNALASLPRSLAHPGLRSLYLEDNPGLEVRSPADWVVAGLPALRVLRVGKRGSGGAWAPASLAHLAGLAARLGAAGRPDVLRVSYPGQAEGGLGGDDGF